MMRMAVAVLAAMLLPGLAQAGEDGDRLAEYIYAGTAAEGLSSANEHCAADIAEACFAEGMIRLVGAYEGLAQDLYRYGATTPGSASAAMLFGIGSPMAPVPANPDPEQLSYDALRSVLEDFLVDIDQTRSSFEKAAAVGDFLVMIDPLKVRIDFDGDGAAGEGETLGALLASAGGLVELPMPDQPPSGKSKGAPPDASALDTTIGFDRADAAWFAGYMQVTAAPVDLILAHDFSEFFDAYLHRVFPKAGLPMQDYPGVGTLFMAPESDSEIADIIAAIHTLRFPVVDAERLAGVRERLKSITTLSRRNWEFIIAETDDNRELVPSPRQTSLVPDMVVTQDVVDAWLATLDTVDLVLDGELLVPHWRFRQGFDLRGYFQTATEADLVMLFTGSGALPFIKEGPVADAESFAEANRVFGTDWLNYAFWFN